MNIVSIGNFFIQNKIKNNNINFGLKLKTLSKDTTSFTSKKESVEDRALKLPDEEFPSKDCADYVKSELLKKDGRTFLDIHKEYYAKLLNCETLEEAKKIYPELKDVIDAKDIDLTKLGYRNTLHKVARGEISGLTIENMSIEFVKKYYAECSAYNNGEYFNIKIDTVPNLFKLLNIKLPAKYFSLLVSGIRRKTIQTLWQDPKFREMEVDKIKKLWMNPEYREMKIKSAKAQWEDSEYTQMISDIMKARWQNPEFREKQIEKKRASLLELWQNPEYIETMNIISNAKALAWELHPEISEKISEVAKDFPYLSKIFAKRKKNIPLTDGESHYLLRYYSACSEAVPNYQKIIGEEQKRILVEWGFYDEK